MPEAVTFWLSDLHTRKSPPGICRMRMSVGDVEEFWSSIRSRVIQVMCENSTIAIWLLQFWWLCQGSRSNKSEQDTMSPGSWPQCWVRSVYFQLSHTLPLAWTIAHQAAFRNLEPNSLSYNEGNIALPFSTSVFPGEWLPGLLIFAVWNNWPLQLMCQQQSVISFSHKFQPFFFEEEEIKVTKGGDYKEENCQNSKCLSNLLGPKFRVDWF